MFIAEQITAQRKKYSYGYKMGTARLMRQKILLPADDSGLPDYSFMSNYMKGIENERLRAVLRYFTAKLSRA